MSENRITQVLDSIEAAVRHAGLIPEGMGITELHAQADYLEVTFYEIGGDDTLTVKFDGHENHSRVLPTEGR